MSLTTSSTYLELSLVEEFLSGARRVKYTRIMYQGAP